MTKLIGLVGSKQSGKSTLLRGLPDNFNVNSISFAEPLYKIAEAIGFSMEQIMDPDYREKPQPILGGKTIRQLLQIAGTEFGRDMISTTLWSDIAMGKIENNKLNVFENIRFQEEFDAVKEKGGITIAIKRPSLNLIDDHSSEKNIERLQKDCDYEFINTGTLEIVQNSFSSFVFDNVIIGDVS